MDTTNLREQLHEYVDKGNEQLLRLMHALAKEYNEEENEEYEFSEEDIRMFDERRSRRLSGESKTYNRQEEKKIITGK